jgi:hypothetical protein
VGRKPFSLSSVAFTSTITRIACLLVHASSALGAEHPSFLGHRKASVPASAPSSQEAPTGPFVHVGIYAIEERIGAQDQPDAGQSKAERADVLLDRPHPLRHASVDQDEAGTSPDEADVQPPEADQISIAKDPRGLLWGQRDRAQQGVVDQRW